MSFVILDPVNTCIYYPSSKDDKQKLTDIIENLLLMWYIYMYLFYIHNYHKVVLAIVTCD